MRPTTVSASRLEPATSRKTAQIRRNRRGQNHGQKRSPSPFVSLIPSLCSVKSTVAAPAASREHTSLKSAPIVRRAREVTTSWYGLLQAGGDTGRWSESCGEQKAVSSATVCIFHMHFFRSPKPVAPYSRRLFAIPRGALPRGATRFERRDSDHRPAKTLRERFRCDRGTFVQLRLVA